MPRPKQGFTLIELLIVVVIIGILAAIAIPKFANTKEKAYVASMKTDLRNLITAQDAYYADNNSYYAAGTANLGTNYRASTGISVVIGGASLAGGRGTILGTVLAAILISMIDNGLQMMNVPSFYQYLVKGSVLLAAVVLDQWYQRRSVSIAPAKAK